MMILPGIPAVHRDCRYIFVKGGHIAMRMFRSLIAALLVASLAISASAAFTPSVEYKDAPEVVVTTDKEGNAVAGTICDAEGTVLATVSAEAITVTPIAAAAKEETDAEVAEKLTAVKEELEAALEDKDNELIAAVAKELKNAPAKNIVVTDVFNIAADEAVEAALAEAAEKGAALTVSLTSQNITKADAKNITIWQKSATTGEWEKVKFTIDEKNVIKLELKDLGEIVIFRDSEAKPEKVKDAPKSPKTLPIRKPGHKRG